MRRAAAAVAAKRAAVRVCGFEGVRGGTTSAPASTMFLLRVHDARARASCSSCYS